jgi:thiamine biosynthesis lipoprotein
VVEASDSTAAGSALERALDRIDGLEAVMSNWRADSELSALNAAGSDGHRCTADLYAVLDSARTFAELTGGAFDPTIEPLNLAFDMRGVGRKPNPDQLEASRALVAWQELWLDAATSSARLARPGMAVDLGGIGKGFALDRAADTLIRFPVRRALFNFGGEVLAIGNWHVTVAHPEDRLRPVLRLAVDDAAVSTSAQSERFTTVGGRRQGHILDPRTGMPVVFAGSVTVVAGSATRADAISTALLVMGRDAARRWASHHREIGVLWIEPNGQDLAVWKWNLADVEASSDVRVSWKN